MQCMTNSPYPKRRVRSFVRRDGRMTEAQERACDVLLPRWGLTLTDTFADFDVIFGRQVPRYLEIGFGSGYSLLEMAKQHPEHDFIGIETHRPGVGTLLHEMEKQQVHNIRIYYEDAMDVLARAIPEESLEGVQIFFPDPWPKRKHHKRRLIQPAFVSLVATKLKPFGVFHLATDWQDYAEDMMDVLSKAEEFINLAGHQQFAKRSNHRPVITKFEQRGKDSGRAIWELQFAKR
jgi:tRNA (guanine-N7-)-methyltransferase